MNFQLQHISTLAKYAGISFIAGAVNHGMFTENRSYVTAALGVLFFLIGSYLEKRTSIHGTKSWSDLLGFGIFASIGLGFFTGGLQHFPDSPERSVWVVPLGFFLSLFSLYMTEGREKIALKSIVPYVLIAGAVVVFGSIGFNQYLKDTEYNHDDHEHAHNNDGGSNTPEKSPQYRVVELEMDDGMRFVPDHFEASVGETVKIIVSNKGKFNHELVIGSPSELIEHANQMKLKSNDHHHMTNAVSVPASSNGELLMTFSESGPWEFACFEPGHYEAGMKGVIALKNSK